MSNRESQVRCHFDKSELIYLNYLFYCFAENCDPTLNRAAIMVARNHKWEGHSMESNTNWKAAFQQLIQGNERFVSGLRSTESLLGHTKLKELAEKGQKPFAIVLSCSDSRVPAELLFDCGFGDLFVIRVAGNVVQPSQIASIEYAAKVLGSSLCVVMGHSKCGAVQAALDSETGKRPNLGPNIDFLIELIRPAVNKCLKDGAPQHDTLDKCIQQNVINTAGEILAKSSLLRGLAKEERFHIVEAIFHLESGKVIFQPLETRGPNEKSKVG